MIVAVAARSFGVLLSLQFLLRQTRSTVPNEWRSFGQTLATRERIERLAKSVLDLAAGCFEGADSGVATNVGLSNACSTGALLLLLVRAMRLLVRLLLVLLLSWLLFVCSWNLNVLSKTFSTTVSTSLYSLFPNNPENIDDVDDVMPVISLLNDDNKFPVPASRPLLLLLPPCVTRCVPGPLTDECCELPVTCRSEPVSEPTLPCDC